MEAARDTSLNFIKQLEHVCICDATAAPREGWRKAVVFIEKPSMRPTDTRPNFYVEYNPAIYETQAMLAYALTSDTFNAPGWSYTCQTLTEGGDLDRAKMTGGGLRRGRTEITHLLDD